MCARSAEARAAALILSTVLALPAAAGGLDLPPEARAAFGAEIRALLLEEPEIVGRALTGPPQYEAEAAQDRAMLAGAAEALLADAQDWHEGPRDGTPLVAFLPPRAGGLLDELRLLVAAQGASRLIVKDFPPPGSDGTAALFLGAVMLTLGPEAWLAAREGLGDLPRPLTRPALLRFGAAMGWPTARLDAAMDSPEAAERLARTRALAAEFGLDMAPSFVAGGILVRGEVPTVVLQGYLDRTRR